MIIDMSTTNIPERFVNINLSINYLDYLLMIHSLRTYYDSIIYLHNNCNIDIDKSELKEQSFYLKNIIKLFETNTSEPYYPIEELEKIKLINLKKFNEK